MKAPRHWPVLALLVLTLLPLLPALLRGHAIGPHDAVQEINGTQIIGGGSGPWDVLQMDGVLQFTPWRHLVFESWRRGEVPLWNPFQLGGTPLLANSQSGGLYPLHVVFAFVPGSLGFKLTLLAWLHVFLAAWGLLALARRLGAEEPGAFLAAAAFGLSAFVWAWLSLPSVVTTVAWIPWALCACIACFERSANPLRAAAGLGGAVAMMFLAGHLQFAAYGAMAISLAFVWKLVAGERRWGAAPAALGVAVGALVAWPQLGTVLAYSEFSHRRNVPTVEGYAAYKSGALSTIELPGLALPGLLGSPNSFADQERYPILSRYWPAMVKRGANFAESAVGLGPLALLLLCFVPWRKLDWRKAGPGVGVGLLGLLLALPTPLGQVLYFNFPGWSSTGSPARGGILFVLGLCAVAALARLPEDEKSPRTRIGVFVGLGLLALAGVSVLGSTAQPWMPNMDPAELRRYVAGAQARSIPLVLASLLAVGAGAYLVLRRQSLAGLGVLLVGALLAMPIPRSAPTLPARPAEIDRNDARVAFVNERWELLGAAPAISPPNLATLRAQSDLGGYDSLLHRDTVAMLAEISGGDPAPPANGNMMFVKQSADERALEAAGVGSLRDGYAARKLNPEPRVQGAEIVDEGLSWMRLRATANQVKVLERTAGPGWFIDVEGARRPVDGSSRWIAFEAAPGQEIRLFRDDIGDRKWAGLAGLLLLASLAALGFVRKKASQAPGTLLE